VKHSHWLIVGLALLVSLTLKNPSSAQGPDDRLDSESGRRVGLVSTTAECVAVRGGFSNSASATVRLRWSGQIEQAFLVLSATGSRGGHSIYINGQFAASAPVRPGGAPCRTGAPAPVYGPTDVIPIPIEVLAQDENVITLTNDADIYDGWTAANVHIEIHGVLTGPPAAALELTAPIEPHLSLDVTAPISGSVLLTCTYELARGRVISQLVSYQIPVGYTGGTSVPLLVGLHGMGGSGQRTRDFLAPEANSRGWLLAAPEMHGSYHINTGEYALAWPGAQHDIIDTIAYMMSQYEVDPSHIYVAGGSMGGQTAAMLAAKYPDVFAAAVPWKPLTDLADWYYELDTLGDPYHNVPGIRNETGGSPIYEEFEFEYQRRSPMEVPQNSRLIPIKMWHDVEDELVPIHHSRDLRDAIDRWDPITPVTLIEIGVAENECPEGSFEHCYNPDPPEVFDYLEGFTLSSQPPLSLTIRTDESKPYYWLNFAQTGGDHWSEVVAAYRPAGKTVTATISETQALTLAFNLGSTPTTGRVMERPGMGLPATTYLVHGGGNYRLENYTSGYLTTSLNTTGQFTLTISAIRVEVSPDPTVVSAGRVVTSTITALVRDQLNTPVPDATLVEFSTTVGTFPNGGSTYVTTTTGGQATAILSLGPAPGLAEISARVERVTGSTAVIVEPVKVYIPMVTRNGWILWQRRFVTPDAARATR
jgi:pimeloyl-ACP methyl ester carboxylesterase